MFGAWVNMQARLAGTKHSHGKYYWAGIGSDFYTWHEFRSWALKNGYSKTNNSLDRIDTDKGYTRDNCRWLPWKEHRAFTHYRGSKG